MSGEKAPDPNAPERLGIGRIGAPHGLDGRVHAKLDHAESDSLRRVDRVVLVDGNGVERELELRSVGGHGQKALLGFVGVSDRDAALQLRGARIEVLRALLPPLEPGEYYLADLVGASVVSPEGPVGTVIRVSVNPSVDSLTIRLEDGREAEQALAAPWVMKVDAAARRIELSGTEGLIL